MSPADPARRLTRVERTKGDEASKQPPAPNATAAGIFALVRRQLGTLSREAPRVMIGDDPDAVHDLRVATRRLQEALAVLGAANDHGSVEAWRRTLRRVRRALGTWRNLDVVLADLKQRRRRTRSPMRRDAWATIRAELERMRVDEAVRARKRLRQASIEILCHDLAVWLSALEDEIEPPFIRAMLAERVASSWQSWQDALAQAGQQGSVTAVHALRIETKRLRYRCELAAEMESAPARAVLAWTRDFQEHLGDWHDQQVLRELVAQVLGLPDFLLRHIDACAVVVGELAREHKGSPGPTSLLPSTAHVDAGRNMIETLLAQIAQP